MIAAALSLLAVVASSEGTERRWTPVERPAAPEGGRPTLCCKVDPYKPGSPLEAKPASPGGVPTADCIIMFSTGAPHCPAGTKSLAPSDGPDYNPSDWVE